MITPMSRGNTGRQLKAETKADTRGTNLPPPAPALPQGCEINFLSLVAEADHTLEQET